MGAKRALVAIAVVAITAVIGMAVIAACSGPTRSVEALCTQLEAAKDLDRNLATLDPSAYDPQLAALRKASQVAPDDIRSQVTTVSDLAAELAKAIENASGDKRAALEEALRARQSDASQVTSAGRDVQTWAKANCGLELNPT